MIATICALFYGDHSKLHAQLLNSLEAFGPSDGVRYRFWLNQVCDQTHQLLGRIKLCNMVAYPSSENVPKYQVMRKLFDADAREKEQPEWLIWFDDDSFVNHPYWWERTLQFIREHRDENVCYFGQTWYVHHLSGQLEFISTAPWYKGVPWEQCPTRTPNVTRPGISFAQGSYWWLRRDVRAALDWPDNRLRHNGGDTLLGEAVRQQGLPFHRFHYGVKLNAARRRGLNERPAGSSVDTRR